MENKLQQLPECGSAKQLCEHRLKVFIGKGNNSRLLQSLITRRIWLGITDRIEEANFAWTQLKSVSYIELQDKREIQETTSRKCEYEYSEGLLSEADELSIRKYSEIYRSTDKRMDERFLPRNKYFKYRKRIKVSCIKENRMHNHFINNYLIGNKKALQATIIDYFNHCDEDVFEYSPVTFHVEGGFDNPQYYNFLKHFYKREKQEAEQMWIIKPGENSNCGNGIKVCLNLDEIKEAIKKKEKHDDRSGKMYIIQEYVQNPLLSKKRKFDIRHFVLITCVNGIMKGYWYKEGYARTSSFEYKKQNIGKIHLTNDAIQKNLPEYGKYEKGNKLSYDKLEEYLGKKREKVSFKGQILPKMKQATRHLVRACSGLLDTSMHQNNFELFGLDFLLDDNYKVYLIEANSNPCLEISSPLISTILPKLIENTLEQGIAQNREEQPQIPSCHRRFDSTPKVPIIFNPRKKSTSIPSFMIPNMKQ